MFVAWILIGVVLLAVELHHLAFFAMFGAAGAFAASVVALLAPWSIPVQVLVAVAVAALGLGLVRPHMSEAFAHRGPGVRIGGVHGGLIGATGVAVDEIGSQPSGHVRLLGEQWLAVTVDGEPIPPSTPVFVIGVVGTTLKVRAIDNAWELT